MRERPLFRVTRILLGTENDSFIDLDLYNRCDDNNGNARAGFAVLFFQGDRDFPSLELSRARLSSIAGNDKRICTRMGFECKLIKCENRCCLCIRIFFPFVLSVNESNQDFPHFLAVTAFEVFVLRLLSNLH